jgi:hypothetical protein
MSLMVQEQLWFITKLKQFVWELNRNLRAADYRPRSANMIKFDLGSEK